jgi:hypothetical protein
MSAPIRTQDEELSPSLASFNGSNNWQLSMGHHNSLLLFAASAAIILLPYLLAKTPLWPQLGAIERKAAANSNLKLFPLSYQHIQGIFNVLGYLQTSYVLFMSFYTF